MMLNAFPHHLGRRLCFIARDQGALVLEHQLADGEIVCLRRGQQLRRVVKGKRKLRLPLFALADFYAESAVAVLNNESAAN